MSALRFAAVGLGWVSVNRHIPAIRRCKGAQLVGVIDHQPGRAEALAAKLGVSRSATSDRAADVSWLSEVDAVTIGTPPRTHHTLAQSYLEAGKHVLIEKPLAMSVLEAEQLVELAAKRNLVLGVFHNFQFTASVKRARRLIRDRRLGETRAIWAIQLSNPRRRLPTWYEELPLGLFYDESPHFFYLLRALTTEPMEFRRIDVVKNEDGVQTPAKINCQLQAGKVPVQIDMLFRAPLSEWHIAVLGSERSLYLDVFRDMLIDVPNDNTHLARDILRTSASFGLGHVAGTFSSGLRVAARRMAYGNDEVLKRFTAACSGDIGQLAGISGSDGVAVVAMQHKVVESLR